MKIDEYMYVIISSLLIIFIVVHIFSYLWTIIHKKKQTEYEKILGINIITNDGIKRYKMIKKTKKFLICLLVSILVICCLIFFRDSAFETKLTITGLTFFIIPCFSKPQTENAIYGEMFAMLWVGVFFGWWIFG